MLGIKKTKTKESKEERIQDIHLTVKLKEHRENWDRLHEILQEFDISRTKFVLRLIGLAATDRGFLSLVMYRLRGGVAVWGKASSGVKK